jgi:hypothetical protein
MRREIYLEAIIAICIAAISISSATAIGGDISDLKNLISSIEKPDMSPQDVATFLAAHGFDATAKNGYVETVLDGKIYKITPNADKPGSYDTEIMIQQCPNTKMYEEDKRST